MFELVSDYAPAGDQPQAIAKLTEGVLSGAKHQTLLGVTGSGKTFTIANVIKNVDKPTLVISHTKRWPRSFTPSSKVFFQTTPSNISSATSIITSPRPTSRAVTRSSKRTPAVTRRSNACGSRL
ncbi:MAG: DEAD/DEAH box helicase family protein [Limisphaerales bacterium]